MKNGSIIVWIWQNTTRWYGVEICIDLIGDLLLIQRWGGKKNTLHGEKRTVLSDLKTGLQCLHKINKQRQSRKDPYKLISMKYY